MPATPPPMTRRALNDGHGSVSPSDRFNRALATAMRTSCFAFLVASDFWRMCTQEHWSRMLAISNRNLFNPASRIVSRNMGSCVRGEQEATITRFRPCSLTAFLIFSWVSCEQV